MMGQSYHRRLRRQRNNTQFHWKMLRDIAPSVPSGWNRGAAN
jgi:hypothetical protein